MGIYMGGTKCRLVTNGNTCGLTAQPYTVITNGIRMLTSDGLLLTDSRGIYTTLRYDVELSSLDGHTLNDINGLRLTATA